MQRPCTVSALPAGPVYRLPSKLNTTRSPRQWAVEVIKSPHSDKAPAPSLTVKDAVLQRIVGQTYGAACNNEHQKEILELISDWQLRHTAEAPADSSSGAPGSSCAPTEGPLDGDWRLLWTTEKSVHQIVKRQLLAPVSDIQQHIDLRWVCAQLCLRAVSITPRNLHMCSCSRAMNCLQSHACR